MPLTQYSTSNLRGGSDDANFQILNNNWHQWTTTFLNALVNPDRIPLDTYEQMQATDETVYSGLEFVTLSVLCRMGAYTHADKRIEAFVTEKLTAMEGSAKTAFAEILSAIAYGYSVTEINWRLDSDGIGLDSLQTLHPSSINFQLETEGPRKNKLSEIWQWKWHGDRAIRIPVEKAIVYSHRSRFGNPFGHSRLKPAFKSWFLKDVMLRFWGLTLERYGAPISWAKAPNVMQMLTDPVTGESITTKDYLMRTLGSMKNHSALVFNNDIELEILYAKHNFGADFEKIVEYCNKMIYRALLLPSLMADSGGTGSYSLGQTHFDLFALTLEQLLKELIEFLIEQLVRRLIEMNFGPQKAGYGTFRVEQFQPQDQKLLADAIGELTTSGYISPTRLQDCNALRMRIGLDEVTQEELDKMQKDRIEAIKAGQAPDQMQPFKDKKAPGKTSGTRTKKERSRITE